MENDALVECNGGPPDGLRVPYSGEMYDESRIAMPPGAGGEPNPELSRQGEVRTHRYIYNGIGQLYRHQGCTE